MSKIKFQFLQFFFFFEKFHENTIRFTRQWKLDILHFRFQYRIDVIYVYHLGQWFPKFTPRRRRK